MQTDIGDFESFFESMGFFLRRRDVASAIRDSPEDSRVKKPTGFRMRKSSFPKWQKLNFLPFLPSLAFGFVCKAQKKFNFALTTSKARTCSLRA